MPKTCISIDMDNYREYRRLLDPGAEHEGESFYLDAIPRYLDLLDEAGARATFFMIGRDAEPNAHRRLLREIARRGHEVGNHSYTHPYNFRALSRERREEEIQRGEEAIADVLGERPLGFRTPSADVDAETLGILSERGYLYDSSVMPSPLMLLFMLYGRLFIRHSDYQLGSPRVIFAPSDPYLPDPKRIFRDRGSANAGNHRIVELPFSLVPLFRFPFYSTLLRILGERFFDACVNRFDPERPVLHFLFHLIDLVDLGDTELGARIHSAPGLGIPVERRRRFVTHAIRALANVRDSVTLCEVARAHLEARKSA